MSATGQQILRRALAGAAVLAVLAGCVDPRGAPEARAVDSRHHNWWNLYNRGLACMAETNYAQALPCFEMALGLRPGARYGLPDEQWRIRTYGLHILDNYFPHRELGICHYHLGSAEKAEMFLEKSIALTPSGRARHYLDLARRMRFSGTTAAPPRFVVHGNGPPRLTSRRQETLSLTIAADAYVAEVRLNGKRLPQEGSSASLAIRETLALAEGRNDIRITAVDLKGQSNTLHWTCFADWTPPEALFDMAGAGAAGEPGVQGRFYDDQGIARITLDGTVLFEAPPDAAPREIVEFLPPPAGEATGEIVDRAGNRTPLSLSGSLFAALPPGPNAAPAARYRGEGPAVPLIRLSQKHSVVFGDDYLLEGCFASPAGLEQAEVDGVSLLSGADAGVRQKPFSRRLPLQMGSNSFVVSARDRNGSAAREIVTVERKQPEKLDQHYRLALRLLPFINPADGRDFNLPVRLLEEALLAPPARFWLIESTDGWEAVLREHALSLSDLADPRAALAAGKLLGADLLCIGQIIRHDSGHTVLVRVVDAHNRMIHLSDIYAEDESRDLSHCLSGWARKLEQQFPLLAGRIVENKRGNLGIDLGSDDGLRAGLRFLVLRPKDPEDMDSAVVLTGARQPVELLVSQVGPKAARGRLIFSEATPDVRKGDCIYAR